MQKNRLAGVIGIKLIHFDAFSNFPDIFAFSCQKEYEESSTNCKRPVTSWIYEKTEESKVGKHTDVCTQLTRAFNLRPPQPKHAST